MGDKGTVNGLMNENEGNEFIINLNEECIILILVPLHINNIYFFFEWKYLVLQNTPEEQIFVSILKNQFCSTCVGEKFYYRKFHFILAYQTLFLDMIT